MTTKRPVRRKVVKGWAIHWEVSDQYWVYPTRAKALWPDKNREPIRCTITYSLPITHRKKK